MKIDHAICIFCTGSGMVTQECTCPTCNGVGYVELSPEAKTAILAAKEKKRTRRQK